MLGTFLRLGAVEGAVGDEGFAGGLLEDDLAGAEELVDGVALLDRKSVV